VGILFVLVLSYFHVLLELPLNFRTLAAIFGGLRPAKAA
jgi:hypothetical protein